MASLSRNAPADDFDLVRDPGAPEAEFARGLLLTVGVLAVAWLLVRSLFVLFGFPPTILLLHIFTTIDTPGLVVVGTALVLLRMLSFRDAVASFFDQATQAGPVVTAVLAVFVVAIAWAGASHVMLEFPVSRDEYMALADAQAFAGGHLLTPVAPEWRQYLRTIQPGLAQFASDNSYWTSLYFPINALVHALALKAGSATLAAPLMAGLSVVLTYHLARRLWPDRVDAALVAALLVGLSPQVIVTAMTPYAMTLHLLTTLVWLSFWIRDDAIGHGGALATGFVAVGVHQVVFHPLLVGPFILALLWQRRWKISCLYIGAYAAICGFWLAYWPLAGWVTGVSLEQAHVTGGGTMIERVAFALAKFNLAYLAIQPLHLLKLVAWQHVLFVPLVVAAMGSWREMPRVLQLALVGAGLTVAAVFLIIADQGHGWGYRYLHGFLGPMALVAAYGWISLTRRLAHQRTQLAGMFVVASAVTALMLLPVLAFKTRAFVTPLAHAAAAIDRSGADVVLVDHYAARNIDDFQRNAPTLERGVKVMLLALIEEAALPELCQRYDVALFGEAQWTALGLVGFPRTAQPHNQAAADRRLDLLRQLGCGRPIAVGALR